MHLEIERKFFVSRPPSLKNLAKKTYVRYFLEITSDFEDRIGCIDGRLFFREKKQKISSLSYTKNKAQITENEFNILKQNSVSRPIARTSYKVSDLTTIKMYEGAHTGLVRAEFEFKSEDLSSAFVSPNWLGLEITNSPLGRDALLSQLSSKVFHTKLQKCF